MSLDDMKRELRERFSRLKNNFVLRVPYIPAKKEGYCSEASASMILKYYGIDVSQEEIHDAGYEAFEEMLPFLERYLTCKQFSASIDDIKASLRSANPVMVRILPKGQRELHTIVVVGFTDDDILVHDPDVGAYVKVKLSDFGKTWGDANNMATFCSR